jgi:hypothetical protein
MIRLIAFAAFALALATSAQAMPAPPVHRADGMTTETQDVGYRYRGVARYGGYRRYGYGTYSPYSYRRYGYGTYSPYSYRRYGYGTYSPYSYRRYGYGTYSPYSYRRYGYGVGRGIARRNIRRGILR